MSSMCKPTGDICIWKEEALAVEGLLMWCVCTHVCACMQCVGWAQKCVFDFSGCFSRGKSTTSPLNKPSALGRLMYSCSLSLFSLGILPTCPTVLSIYVNPMYL